MYRAVRSCLKSVGLFPVNRPKIWKTLRALLTALPVMVLAYVKFDFGQSEPVHHKAFVNLVASTPYFAVLMIVAASCISVIFDVYEWLGDYLRLKQTDFVPDVQMAKTLAGLNSIVGTKLDRLGRIALDLESKKLDPTKALEECTRPEEQIKEIVNQIWLVMTSLTGSQRLEIVLVSAERSSVKEFAAYMPQTKKPKNELLEARDTFFEHVAATGKFQCIEDISKLLQKRAKLTNTARRARRMTPFHEIDPDTDNGSICGFPLFDNHLNEVAYVLTIKHDEPEFVTKAFRRKYGTLLEHFFVRILLEHKLRKITNHAR